MPETMPIIFTELSAPEALDRAAARLSCPPALLVAEEAASPEGDAALSVRFKTLSELAADPPGLPIRENIPPPPPADGRGHFSLSFRADGVYMTVHAPEGKFRPLSVTDVLPALLRKRVRDVQGPKVKEGVEEPGREVMIAEPQEEFRIDEAIEISVSPDRMTASAVLRPPDGGRSATWPELLAALGNAGVTEGVLPPGCEAFLTRPQYNVSAVLARGTPPARGEDGRLEYHFRTERTGLPLAEEGGRVDYKNLDLIENVKKGQPLVTNHPPGPGRPGVTVTGVPLPPAPGKACALPGGRGVEPSPDGTRLLAALDGRVELEGRRVCVYAQYEIPGDVDPSVGHVDFLGDVLVRGGVLAGYAVKAGGSVDVCGPVEGRVEAARNVTARGGIRGQSTAQVFAGGDVVTTFIEGAYVSAGGSVTAESIIQSTVEAQAKVFVKGARGLVAGGVVRAAEAIVAQNAGTQSYTPTVLETGVSPQQKARYEENRSRLETRRSEFTRLDMVLARLRKLAKAGALPAAQQEQARKLQTATAQISDEIARLEEETEALRRQIENAGKGAVHIRETVFPGVRIQLGSLMYKVDEACQFTSFKEANGEVAMLPFHG